MRRRSSRRPSRVINSTTLGNSQEGEQRPCPLCGSLLPGDHILWSFLGEVSSLDSDTIRRRLLNDPEFANRFRRINDLAVGASPGNDLTDEALAIAEGDPTLTVWIHASNAVLAAVCSPERLQKRRIAGKLRFVSGPDIAMPIKLPLVIDPRSQNRIFANRDTGEWALIAGEMTRDGWWPLHEEISKEELAAMLDIKMQALEHLIFQGFVPGRIPRAAAHHDDAVYFRRDELMAWPTLRKRLRNWRPR